MGRENVMEVKFYDTVNDELLKFAVIISQSNGKWVFCKHKERDTYEVPGGHREAGEDIFETAKRELQEETGAIKFEIKPICVYSVTGKTRVNDTGEETFGLLCFAEITEFAKELHSEMEKVVLMNELPENWTYPLIQPKLIEKYLQIEKQSYSRIQMVAKQTIEYIKKIIKPGMNLLEIRKFCEEKLLELRQKHKSDEKLYNRANVYCGCYKIKTFVEKMAEKCKLDMEKYAEINELSGRFYIFSVQIDLDGKLTEEGVQISPFFYAVLCMIKSEGINVNIMQEDIWKKV